MKYTLPLSCVILATLSGIVRAQTLSVTQLSAIRLSQSAPPTSFFGPQGQTLFLQAAVNDINGTYADDGVFALPATTSGPASGGTYSIPFAQAPSFNGVYYWQAYAPIGYSNPWTLQFGDKGGLGAPVQTPAEIVGRPLPFASGIKLSGDPDHPTFTWTHAQASQLSGSFLVIYDGQNEVFGAPLGTGDVTYTLPPASAGGYDLVAGTTYYFNISAYALRPGQTTLCNNTCIAAISSNFIVYAPPSATLPLVHIPEPTSADPSATHLQFAVSPGRKVFTYVAPVSANGYAYQAFSGPNFAAVTLPVGQSSDFTISYISGGTAGTGTVAPGKTYTFPVGGVSQFVIIGVSPAAPSGFITALEFAGSGAFIGTQSALSSAMISGSEPAAPSGIRTSD